MLKHQHDKGFNRRRNHDLRREYDILKSLDHDMIIKALEYYEDEEDRALILEDFAGVSLRSILDQEIPGIQDFLNWSVKLCDAVSYLHKSGIIHKDIRPDNILVDKISDDIKLIEFDIASLIPKESMGLMHTGIIEANIRYASPEQTGRMNRSLDYRSDIYSMGISFYEILTGKVPFESNDPIEIVHAHLAVIPVAPHLVNPEVPETLSQIVMKMIEKVPERRYKNLLGLKHDLQKCQQQFKETKEINDFPLAQLDISDRLIIPEKLYGREKEISKLLECFELCCQGHSQFLTVYGAPGIGKSMLINEVQKPIVEKRGLFVRGKFDQFQRDIPYSAIISAFKSLISEILSSDVEEINDWKDNIQDALGTNAQLIINVIPELEKIIGPQSDVQDLPPAESANRFNLIFKRFIRCFSKGPRPLVLFLDDMQWADLPSLNLIKFILSDWKKNYLMLISAYRDNEVSRTHPLSVMIQDLSEFMQPSGIHLRELNKDDLREILMDSFHQSKSEILELSQIIDEKTKRNPFFIYEFIKNLYKKELIFFDYSKNSWSWSIHEIKKSNITDNVAELISANIQALNTDTRQLCSMASCIGNNFNLNTLSIIAEKGIYETASLLWDAIHEGIILPLNENYRLTYSNHEVMANTPYKFLHDRVQQACYALITEEDKSSIHLKIGRLLNRKLSTEQKQESLFDIANHFNIGKKLIKERQEKIETAQLNLLAGQKAKNSSAFSPAFRYFNSGIELLEKDSWDQYYALSLELHNEAAETAYLSSLEDEMLNTCRLIFENAHHLLDTVKAYTIMIQAYGSQSKNEQAVNTSFEILEKLGIRLPKNPGQIHLLKSLMATKWRLRGKSMDQLYSLKEMDNARWNAAMSVLSVVTGPAYIYNTNLFILIVFKMIELSLKYGNNKYTSFAYAIYGIVLAGPLMAYDDVQKYGELSRKLLKKYDSDELKCKVDYVLGTCIHWNQPRQYAATQMFNNIQIGLETGDFLYASYAVNMYLALKFYTATSLTDLKEELDQYCLMLESINQDIGLGWTNTFMQMIENLCHKTKTETRLEGSYMHEKQRFDHMLSGNDNAGIGLLHITKSMLAYMLGDYENAYEYSLSANESIEAVLGMDYVNGHNFFNGLILSAAYEYLPNTKKSSIKRKLKSALKTQSKWARFSPENNLSRLEILKAQLRRIENKYEDSEHHLKNAIRYAGEFGNVLENCIASELLAEIYRKNGVDEKAMEQSREALKNYYLWGANAKIRQLEHKFGVKLSDSDMESFEKHEAYSPDIISEEYLDLQSVIKASQALSSEVQITELLKKTGYIIMENAGATRCSIFLRENESWHHEITRYSVEGKDSQTVNQIDISSIEIEELKFPSSLINQVIKTGESILIDDAQNHHVYKNDEYIKSRKSKSILCFPFSSKGIMKGIIYLENSITPAAFTERRKKLLSVISSQMAISLENARLYENLEQKVKERTVQITEQKNLIELEQKKSEKLLLNILPSEIANELKDTGIVKPKRFEGVSVLFTDFVRFSQHSEHLDAEELLKILNLYYSAFDRIVSEHKLEKIKTIGDSYMCAGGLPIPDANHAINTVNAALQIQKFIETVNRDKKEKGQKYFECRIGIHSGSVIAGIVGTKKFAYDIWGDNVNIASRMETTSEAGKINISGNTYALIKDQFDCEYRGQIEAKNRGLIDMYFVNGKKEK